MKQAKLFTIGFTKKSAERRFLELLERRHAELLVTPDELRESCLLCSEPKPDPTADP